MDALSRSFYVVRHAKAGSRSRWTGDDRLRPLSKKGRKQAEELVEILEPYPIRAIISSPYVRCVETVEPVARARRMDVNSSAALVEGRGLDGLNEFLLDPGLDQIVLSTHGDIVWELVEYLVNRKLIRPGDGGFAKGSTWVLEVDEEVVKAQFLPAP
ncbi:MAG TPA: phosphoglycerate mutase family protein [Candidatus Dormibacteraeota bacterium]|nr:phosphoglycerate mutase family protein [Candidatus Dormibacteraeota bacterium]